MPLKAIAQGIYSLPFPEPVKNRYGIYTRTYFSPYSGILVTTRDISQASRMIRLYSSQKFKYEKEVNEFALARIRNR